LISRKAEGRSIARTERPPITKKTPESVRPFQHTPGSDKTSRRGVPALLQGCIA